MNPNFNHKSFLAKVSPLPGVYQMFDAKNKVIYIGKAKNLQNRLRSYFNKSVGVKAKALVKQIHTIEITITHTETEALILENTLIKKHSPRYNILLRDDKSYPYIYLSAHRYPRLSLHRGVKRAKGQYLGPYPSAAAVRSGLKFLQKIFPIRQCEDSFFNHRSRPCLQAQIGRCSAPCVDLISPEDYALDVAHTKMFLNGKNVDISRALEEKMQIVSAKKQYEQAAKYRDQITHLRQIQEKQFVENLHGSFDVLAITSTLNSACVQLFVYRNGQNLGNRTYFFSNVQEHSDSEVLSAFITQHYLDHAVPNTIITNIKPEDNRNITLALSKNSNKRIVIKQALRGEKVRLVENALTNVKLALQNYVGTKSSILQQLESIRDICDFDSPPQHIECFDISHTGGESTVASCVVFINGSPSKADYRKFNLKGITPGDDYSGMKQAVTRRYTRMVKVDANLPDLLIIDGGRGQLNQVLEIMEDLQINVPVLGIAKGTNRRAGEETLLFGGISKKLETGKYPGAFLLIQRIRDEAHRFAITGHRAKRNKQRVTSVLQKVPKIGPKKRKELLSHFGGLREVKKAGIPELVKVKGISEKLAQDIYNFFHS